VRQSRVGPGALFVSWALDGAGSGEATRARSASGRPGVRRPECRPDPCSAAGRPAGLIGSHVPSSRSLEFFARRSLMLLASGKPTTRSVRPLGAGDRPARRANLLPRNGGTVFRGPSRFPPRPERAPLNRLFGRRPRSPPTILVWEHRRPGREKAGSPSPAAGRGPGASSPDGQDASSLAVIRKLPAPYDVDNGQETRPSNESPGPASFCHRGGPHVLTHYGRSPRRDQPYRQLRRTRR